MMLDPIRVGLMCRFTLAKWCNGNTPIMPTTIAVSMIFATVQSRRRSWPMSTLNFPTPPFCKRKPNTKPNSAPVINLGTAATGGTGFFVDCLTALPGSIIISSPFEEGYGHSDATYEETNQGDP